MASYYIWTVGCQMNEADSERLASALDQMGYRPTPHPEDADVIVLNSCVVRQGVEDKVASRLDSLKSLKRSHPDKVIALMGCMVGPRVEQLKECFPHVDLFMRPQQYGPLLELLADRDGTCLDNLGPLIPTRPNVTAFIPIIHGCDKFCTFCIIPYRRGRERSRPIEELYHEIETLVRRGVKEVTLLGQNVDSYGHDLPSKPDLSDLLKELNKIEGLKRIRFLTSHPKDMSQKIIDAVAELDKVCEHINLPVQAGDDDILRAMRRGYTADDYRELVGRIRSAIPGVSMSTDIIVGFPGEGEAQFQRTVNLLAELKLDKIHVAAYSERPGTIAYRKLPDDVTWEEKRKRVEAIEQLQERVATEINARLLGRTEEILVEERKKGKWQGRTRTNKLVFFEGGDGLLGAMVNIKIEKTSPWSLQGTLVKQVIKME